MVTDSYSSFSFDLKLVSSFFIFRLKQTDNSNDDGPVTKGKKTDNNNEVEPEANKK